MAVTPADRNGQEAINEINNGDGGFEVSSGQDGVGQVQKINNDEDKESRASMLSRHQKKSRDEYTCCGPERTDHGKKAHQKSAQGHISCSSTS